MAVNNQARSRVLIGNRHMQGVHNQRRFHGGVKTMKKSSSDTISGTPYAVWITARF